jgi:molecular chaperone IbpA
MTNTYTWPGQSWTIGFDSMFDRIEKLQSQQQGYPPHNVVNHGEDKYEIALAVAGFNEKDLFVEQEENVLTIASSDVEPGYPTQNSENKNKEYIHKGIATRKFKRKFTLSEYVEVESVALVDGILSVYLAKNIPEEKKPKSFKIGAETPQFLSE